MQKIKLILMPLTPPECLFECLFINDKTYRNYIGIYNPCRNKLFLKNINLRKC